MPYFEQSAQKEVLHSLKVTCAAAENSTLVSRIPHGDFENTSSEVSVFARRGYCISLTVVVAE